MAACSRLALGELEEADAWPRPPSRGSPGSRRPARSARTVGAARPPEGYRRAFVEGGTPVRLLLADHLHGDPAHRALAARLLDRLRAGRHAHGRRGGGAGRAA